MKKICILGADGQLGTFLTNELKGHAITPLTRKEFNIMEHGNYEKLLDFDIVINAAAYTNVIGAETDPLNFDVNHIAVQDISMFLKDKDVHFIHFSSNMIFTPKSKNHHKELDLLKANPSLKYGRAKLDGDISIHESRVDFTIIRPVWLHAQGEQNFITKMMSFGKNDLSIATDDIANFTTGNMILRFLDKVIDEKILGDFNLCTNEAVSRYELFSLFVKVSSMDYNLSEAKMSDYGLNVNQYEGLLMDNSKVKEHIEIFTIEEELKLWWDHQEKR